MKGSKKYLEGFVLGYELNILQNVWKRIASDKKKKNEKNIDIVFRVFNKLRKTINITFHFKQLLTKEELASLLKWKLF